MAYFIKNSHCDGCGNCHDVCMNNAILDLHELYLIDPNWCMECGSCSAICYNSAIGYTGLDAAPEFSEESYAWIEQAIEIGDYVFI